MSRGPKPIPGNTAASGLPQAPSWLSDDEQRLWEGIVPALACEVSLSPVDSLALGDMIRCLSRLRAAEREVDERGPIVVGHRGVQCRNPAISVAKNYRESFQWYSKQFGLDLKSRLRLPKSTGGTESPLETARRKLTEKASQTVQ